MSYSEEIWFEDGFHKIAHTRFGDGRKDRVEIREGDIDSGDYDTEINLTLPIATFDVAVKKRYAEIKEEESMSPWPRIPQDELWA